MPTGPQQNEGIEQEKASARDAKKELLIARANLNNYAALCSTTRSSRVTAMHLVHPNAPKVSECANSTRTNIQPITTKDSSNAKLAASASTLIRILHALHGHPQPRVAKHAQDKFLPCCLCREFIKLSGPRIHKKKETSSSRTRHLRTMNKSDGLHIET